MPRHSNSFNIFMSWLVMGACCTGVQGNEGLNHRGVLRSAHVAAISSTLASKIRTVVPEGSLVKKGDLLISLDDTDINKQLDKQQIAAKAAAEALAQAEVELKTIETEQTLDLQLADRQIEVAQLAKERVLGENGQHRQAITTAEGQYERAQLNLRLANRRLDRVQENLNGNLSDELIQCQIVAVEAKTELENAKRRLAYLSQIETAHLEATLELEVLKSKIERINSVQQHMVQTQQASKAYNSRKKALDSVTQRLRQYEEYIAQCQIFAPFDGLVQRIGAGEPGIQAVPAIGPGTSVRPGRPILQLVKIDALEVELEVDEKVLSKIGVDQPAAIRFDALPNLSLDGHVARIYLRSDPTNFANEGAYVVRVAVDAPNANLRVGMTATVDIEVGK